MNSIFLRFFQIAFRLVEIVLPALAGKWGIKLFFSPFKHKRPHRETLLLQDAIRQKINLPACYDTSIASPHFVMYSWGQGPAILLVHGWSGRGSQVATLAKPLVEAGYRVVTFDGLAHGDSPGKQTTILDFVQIIKHLDRAGGPFEAIIGHSFGGVAAALAITEGLSTGKLVTIGSPASMAYVFAEFAKQINASEKTIEKVAQAIERVAQRAIDDFSLANLAAQIQQPGLIVHDKRDKEVNVVQALTLAERWPGSQLLLTEGLGHQRILRDPATIAKIIAFIAAGQLQPEDNRPVPQKISLDEPASDGIIKP
jgi:pimeloyl-ACP methyl ester carboxylesterase